MSINLPPWLHKGAIALHTPTQTAFIVEQLRRSTTGAIALLDAPSGTPGTPYPLAECQPATLTHFDRPTRLVTRGRAVLITRQGAMYRLSNGAKVGRVMVDEVAFAAAAIALFFDGEVVSCS
jgi:hypothetical protein